MASLLTPDICVIGAETAGLAAAEAARGYGATVVLVESDRMGGAKLHLGSVPSKALAAAAARAQAVRMAAAFGVTADEPKVNFGRIHDHIQQVIAALSPAGIRPSASQHRASRSSRQRPRPSTDGH